MVQELTRMQNAIDDLTAVVSKATDQAQKQQARVDAKAIALVEEYLDAPNGESQMDVNNLKKAISKASAGVRTTTFFKARNHRKALWKNPAENEKMARAQHIFEAIINAESGEFHRNYAQLGFTLKEKRPAEWKAAIIALKKAITLRDENSVPYYGIYEMNLADCLIAEAKASATGGPMSADQVDELRRLIEIGTISAKLSKYKRVEEWLAANPVQGS